MTGLLNAFTTGNPFGKKLLEASIGGIPGLQRGHWKPFLGTILLDVSTGKDFGALKGLPDSAGLSLYCAKNDCFIHLGHGFVQSLGHGFFHQIAVRFAQTHVLGELQTSNEELQKKKTAHL